MRIYSAAILSVARTLVLQLILIDCLLILWAAVIGTESVSVIVILFLLKYRKGYGYLN